MLKNENKSTVDARALVYEVEAIRLLDHVNLEARNGEFVGLVGPNGAGKSTLLKTISGILKSNEGSITLGGNDLSNMSAKEVAHTLASVPQLTPYTYGFTSLEVVLMGRYPTMGLFQVEGSDDRRIALESMALTETDSFAHRDVTTLSGGERQRVFFARALAQQPQILLLDEPTSNLDISHQLKVLEIVNGLVDQGMTAIASIHDLSLAARYCHRLVLISHGCVLEQGSPDQVLTPKNIKDAFGVSAVVFRNPFTNTLTVSPLEQTRVEINPIQSGSVHILCGGGTGARLMYSLQRAGIVLTACPLGAGDTDRMAADVLGIDYIPVPAFSAIDDKVHSEHRNMVAAADVTVVCPIPIGPHNLRNLESLTSAKRLIVIDNKSLTERDFTGGQAAKIFDQVNPLIHATTVDQSVAIVTQILQTVADKSEI